MTGVNGNSHTQLPYRADLQGLRAVAVTLVVLAHAGMPALPGGFVGVDVFFVLSGYLITGLLVREHLARGHIGIMAFIARRLRRLLPALLTMLSLVMLMATVLLSSHELSEQTASVGYAATWTSNLFFAFTTFDYFAELHLRDLFLHTWSLGVEEQFYLLWPLLFLMFFLFARRTPEPRRSHSGLLIVLGALFASSLAISLYWASTDPLLAFYLMPSRGWQFALGAGVFVWIELLRPRSDGTAPRAVQLQGLLGLILILGSAVFLNPQLGYPGLWALLPSIGAALVIAAGCRAEGHGVTAVLSHPALVWIGDRSYSWYLWHWPLLMLGFAWGLQASPTATAALVLLSFLFAMVSYRLVELPFWKGRFSGSAPRLAIVLSASVMAAVATVLVQTNLAYRNSGERAAQLARTARQDMAAIYRSFTCDSWYTDSAVRPCVTGDQDATRTAVLLADSIGAQWYPVMAELFAQEDWRLVVMTKSACAIVDEDYYYNAVGGIYQVCTDWRNQALSDLAAMRPDVVFIGSAATYGFSEAQWSAGTGRILDRLSEVAGRVVVIPGTPQLSFDGPGCLERWLAKHGYDESPAEPVCRESLAGSEAPRVTIYLERATKRYGNAQLLNLNDLVCPDGYCAARSAEGLVVFRDQKHLTRSFVRAQVPEVRRRLLQMGLDSLLPD